MIGYPYVIKYLESKSFQCVFSPVGHIHKVVQLTHAYYISGLTL